MRMMLRYVALKVKDNEATLVVCPALKCQKIVPDTVIEQVLLLGPADAGSSGGTGAGAGGTGAGSAGDRLFDPTDLAQLQQYLNETVPEHILCHSISVDTHISMPPPAHAPATVSVPRPLDSLPVLVRRFRRFECDALVSTAADLRWCPTQGCGHVLQRCTTQGACSRARHARVQRVCVRFVRLMRPLCHVWSWLCCYHTDCYRACSI